MSDEKSSPKEDKEQEKPAPDSGESGKADEKKSTEAPLKVTPEKLQGKSPEEVTKMYVELEKKIGEQSTKVSEAKKLRDDMDVVLKAIWADPDLYRQVETGIKKYQSGDSLPEGRGLKDKMPDKKTDDKKGDEEAKKDQEVNPEVLEIRKSEENRVLNDFFKKFGYSNLNQDQRKEKYAQLAMSLAELVDPSGKRPIANVLRTIPLSKLPKYLENAHFIVNKDELIQKGKRSAMISQEENNQASIGSFAASSGKKDGSVQLTNRERDVARKMGVSEEKYAKRKAEMIDDANRFE